MSRSIYKNWALEIVVFMCGALVMIFEIIGSRILSPFIGTSTYVWTSLIGVILASLSLGYWLGGVISDRRPIVRLLAAVIFAAGGLISITILTKDVLLSMIASYQFGIEVKALISALLLFAPASVCLGIVTPFAVRLKMTSVEQTGRTVGRLYALSTVGSIIGTFTAGFFLIPFIGSVRTLYLIAVSLIALAVLLAPFAPTKTNIAAICVLVLGVTASEANIYVLRTQSDVYDIDTEYSRARIFITKDAVTGRNIRALATDPYFVQSAMFMDSDDLVFEYGRYYHLLRYFKPDFSRTLIIGGAGYSFPREYLRHYPGAAVDVAEIDPQMTALARKYFRLSNDRRMSIFHEDGRMFVNRTPAAAYDVLLMDAFSSLLTVPYHLTTVEAAAQMSRVLKDDGVVIFNIGAAIQGPASRFLHAELKTFEKVFPHVYLFKIHADYTDERLQNLIIVACKSYPPNGLESNDPEIARLLSHRYTSDIPLTDNILTDDLAPVEYYNSIAQRFYEPAR